eukprot:279957_1
MSHKYVVYKLYGEQQWNRKRFDIQELQSLDAFKTALATKITGEQKDENNDDDDDTFVVNDIAYTLDDITFHLNNEDFGHLIQDTTAQNNPMRMPLFTINIPPSSHSSVPRREDVREEERRANPTTTIQSKFAEQMATLHMQQIAMLKFS